MSIVHCTSHCIHIYGVYFTLVHFYMDTHQQNQNLRMSRSELFLQIYCVMDVLLICTWWCREVLCFFFCDDEHYCFWFDFNRKSIKAKTSQFEWERKLLNEVVNGIIVTRNEQHIRREDFIKKCLITDQWNDVSNIEANLIPRQKHFSHSRSHDLSLFHSPESLKVIEKIKMHLNIHPNTHWAVHHSFPSSRQHILLLKIETIVKMNFLVG